MGLKMYIARRIVISIIIIWIVASLNFVIFQVASPIDPSLVILSPSEFAKDQIKLLRQMYGLDDPIHIRYLKYVRNLLSFGIIPPYFGVSFETKTYVAAEMWPRLTLTLLLLGSALIGNLICGIPLGIMAASKRGGKMDVTIIGTGLLTWGVPVFFIQLLAVMFIIYVYSTYGLRILPEGGTWTIPPSKDPLTLMQDIIWHVTLPVITLVLAGFGSWALYTRNLMIDALTSDYVVTARAKGLSERRVLLGHAFRGILPPIATMITLAIPGLVTGAIITESIFNWRGIGSWYITSLLGGNYPVTQAVLFIYAVLVIVFNFIADILYGVLDPRIRVGMRR